MNTEILKRMSSEGLKTLQAAIAVELESRFDMRPLPGRTGWFEARHQRRHATILSMNRKTISVQELSDSASPGNKWRIDASMFTVDAVEKPRVASSAPISSKPATTETAW